MKSYLYLSLQLFILLQKISFSKTNKNYRNTWNVVSQEKKNFSEAMNICRLVYNGSLVVFADLNQSETQDICTNVISAHQSFNYVFYFVKTTKRSGLEKRADKLKSNVLWSNEKTRNKTNSRCQALGVKVNPDKKTCLFQYSTVSCSLITSYICQTTDSHKQKEQGMQVKAVAVKNNREGTIPPNLTENSSGSEEADFFNTTTDEEADFFNTTTDEENLASGEFSTFFTTEESSVLTSAVFLGPLISFLCIFGIIIAYFLVNDFFKKEKVVVDDKPEHDFANFDESFEESNIRKFLSEDEDSEVNSASEPETQT